MNINELILALGILVAYPLVVLTAPHVQHNDDWNETEMARMKNGEVLLETLYEDMPGGAASVTALFYSSTDAVWNVIGGCKYEFIYVRGLKQCDVLEAGENRMLMQHRVRNSWYTPTLDFTFEANRHSSHFGEARLVKGDLLVLDGQWRMVSVPGDSAVIVTHEIRIQSKMPAPRWLIRRSLRKDLPDMLACVRGLANASGDNRRIGLDLDQCPGDFSSVLK